MGHHDFLAFTKHSQRTYNRVFFAKVFTYPDALFAMDVLDIHGKQNIQKIKQHLSLQYFSETENASFCSFAYDAFSTIIYFISVF
jgi:hypothetical protein